ncbi:dodecin domain-containing protein, partial [Saccharopolyspora sp. NPDC050642]
KEGVDDAIRKAVKRASQTLRNVDPGGRAVVVSRVG